MKTALLILISLSLTGCFQRSQIDQGEVEPVLLHTVQPIYPDKARKEGLSGSVFLRFIVNVDGSVSDVVVMKGPVVFHKAAVEAMLQFRFKPAKKDGKVVAVWMTQRIDFQLEI